MARGPIYKNKKYLRAVRAEKPTNDEEWSKAMMRYRNSSKEKKLRNLKSFRKHFDDLLESIEFSEQCREIQGLINEKKLFASNEEEDGEDDDDDDDDDDNNNDNDNDDDDEDDDDDDEEEVLQETIKAQQALIEVQHKTIEKLRATVVALRAERKQPQDPPAPAPAPALALALPTVNDNVNDDGEGEVGFGYDHNDNGQEETASQGAAFPGVEDDNDDDDDVEVEVDGGGYSPIASSHDSSEGSGDDDDDDDDDDEDSGSSVVVVAAATTTTPPSSHPASKPPALEVLPRYLARRFPSARGSGVNSNSGPTHRPPIPILCKAPKYSHPAVAGVAAGTSDYGMAHSVPSGMDLMPNHRPAGNEDEDDATLQEAKAVSGVAAGTSDYRTAAEESFALASAGTHTGASPSLSISSSVLDELAFLEDDVTCSKDEIRFSG